MQVLMDVRQLEGRLFGDNSACKGSKCEMHAARGFLALAFWHEGVSRLDAFDTISMRTYLGCNAVEVQHVCGT